MKTNKSCVSYVASQKTTIDDSKVEQINNTLIHTMARRPTP